MRLLAELFTAIYLRVNAALSVAAGRAFGRRAKQILVLILAWIAIAVALDGFVKRYQQQALEAAQYAEQAAQFKRDADRALVHADSLAKLDKTRQKRIKKLEGDVARLRGQLPDQELTDSLRAYADSIYATLSDSLLGAYRIIPVQRGIIVRQDSTIRVQALIIVKQDTVITEQGLTIKSVTSARDSLAKVLSQAPGAPKPERFLGIFPMPSRTTSMLVGALGGAVVTAWAIR